MLRLAPSKVELDQSNGAAVWSIPMSSVSEPDLVAEGDFTGDGVPDFIVEEMKLASPAESCAGQAMYTTQLVFIDGVSGRTWRPVPPTLDICWTAFGYATHQFGVGTAYIGPFAASGTHNDVIVFPYYAQSGWVLRFDATHGWHRVEGASPDLVYPSTAAFDDVYNSTNSTPCAALSGRNECFVQYSHVPNAVFIGGHGSPNGLLVLTSDRAVVYRSDFTPTSDFVWSYDEGGGRNYGLVESQQVAGGQMVTLVGGCSVAKSRDDQRTGQLSTDGCGLHHHYEYFFLQGDNIVQHDGEFFGWAGTDGLWQNRLEFPFPSVVPLAGGSLWSIFNLYRDGVWRAELLPNPADPASGIEASGWFVWGSLTDRYGHVLLAATRTAASPATAVASYVPPWGFDLLRWEGGGLVSLAHLDGVTPSLALYPPGPAYHASDGDTFGLVEKQSNRGMLNQLLVESLDGTQSWVSVPDSRAA